MKEGEGYISKIPRISPHITSQCFLISNVNSDVFPWVYFSVENISPTHILSSTLTYYRLQNSFYQDMSGYIWLKVFGKFPLHLSADFIRNQFSGRGVNFAKHAFMLYQDTSGLQNETFSYKTSSKIVISQVIHVFDNFQHIVQSNYLHWRVCVSVLCTCMSFSWDHCMTLIVNNHAPRSAKIIIPLYDY